MWGLQKIRDLSERFDVSTRTLRYYEEIGILWSERKEFSQYRYYDDAAVRRLEQILVLRKLQLPIKDIKAILTTQELQVAVESLTRHLQSVEAEIESLESLREVVSGFLSLLRRRGFDGAMATGLLQDAAGEIERHGLGSPPHPLKMEVKKMAELNQELGHVRIVELKPVKVAYYRAESASPEADAWAFMLKWVREQGLDRLAATRYFGFNNPGPSPSRAEYGYEVWVTVPDEFAAGSGQVEVKPFAGGLYAVTTTYLYEIGERWQKLVTWVKAHGGYEMTAEQCLEESIGPEKEIDENSQLDLLLPIRKK